MRDIDARNLVDELVMHYADKKVWSINDWKAKIPHANFSRLEMLAEHAESHDPSSAGKIRGHMNRINKLVYQVERNIGEISDSEARSPDLNTNDSDEFLERTGEKLEGQEKWMNLAAEFQQAQERLRLYILELLELLKSIV